MRPWVRGVVAVGGGFLVTATASTVADAIMHAAGVLPRPPGVMSDGQFAMASTYRALFTVAGGFTAARLAPDRSLRYTWILAWIGFVAGLGGVIAFYVVGGPQMGPAWYAISIPVEAIPCVWLGGQLAIRTNSQ